MTATGQDTEDIIAEASEEAPKTALKKAPSPATIKRRMKGLEATRAFGAELKRRRLGKGYSFMRALVEDMGNVSEPYMSQVERGFRSDDGRPVFMSDDKMIRLSQVLGWPMSDMYGILGRLPKDRENIFELDRARIVADWERLTPRDQFLLLRELAAAMAPPGGGRG